ncbi:hypothetical protein BDM02DRAFT_2889409 [Thelephora ganbajun]|uniref:Uncharacterized protein n=1 Tax=Thelephora ganbajun TaxID=370292 RepID=A0ACB6ZAN4_THEGA|nr:hypothetical protein BDM02DRAFT_2889409 [Thelephora ganbajun]
MLMPYDMWIARVFYSSTKAQVGEYLIVSTQVPPCTRPRAERKATCQNEYGILPPSSRTRNIEQYHKIVRVFTLDSKSGGRVTEIYIYRRKDSCAQSTTSCHLLFPSTTAMNAKGACLACRVRKVKCERGPAQRCKRCTMMDLNDCVYEKTKKRGAGTTLRMGNACKRCRARKKMRRQAPMHNMCRSE